MHPLLLFLLPPAAAAARARRRRGLVVRQGNPAEGAGSLWNVNKVWLLLIRVPHVAALLLRQDGAAGAAAADGHGGARAVRAGVLAQAGAGLPGRGEKGVFLVASAAALECCIGRGVARPSCSYSVTDVPATLHCRRASLQAGGCCCLACSQVPDPISEAAGRLGVRQAPW